MDAAEGTFDFDLELKKRSFLATILDKNSYTFNWIPGWWERGSTEGGCKRRCQCSVHDAWYGLMNHCNQILMPGGHRDRSRGLADWGHAFASNWVAFEEALDLIWTGLNRGSSHVWNHTPHIWFHIRMKVYRKSYTYAFMYDCNLFFMGNATLLMISYY